MIAPLPITFAVASIRAECESLRDWASPRTIADRIIRIEQLCDEIERAAETTRDAEPTEGVCGCGSKDARFAPNPYASEINGNETPVWMCDECRHQAAMDI